MKLTTVLSIILAAGFIGTLLYGNQDALRLLVASSRNLDPSIEPVGLSWPMRLIVVLSIVAVLVGAVVANHILHETQNRLTEQSQKFMQLEQARKDEAADQKRRRDMEKAEKLKRHIEDGWRRVGELSAGLERGKKAAFDRNVVKDFERRLDKVEQVNLPSGKIVLSGERRLPRTAIADAVKEYSVWSEDTGKENALVVVHLFQEKAFWKFKSPNVVINGSGEGNAEFWELLETPDMQKELSKSDLVIGLGLSSKTRTQDPYLSRDRAAHLCSGITGSLRSFPKVLIYGLDIGEYEGAQSESESKQRLKLRPVILVAIKVMQPDADFKEFHEELLHEVEIGGVDLGLFSKLKAEVPTWITQQQCQPTFKFINLGAEASTAN